MAFTEPPPPVPARSAAAPNPPAAAGRRAEAYFTALMRGPLMRGPAVQAPAAQALRTDALEAAGPWRLGRVIGRGGTGIVYETWTADAESGAPAVVKVARTGLSPDAAARFPEESRTLALFEHDAVVRGYGAGELPDGRPYLAMERVRGTPVTRHARGLSVRRRLALFRDVCEAVAVVHRRRVVHCDLKPGNVFVTADGRVKLLDFGIAQRLGGVPTASDTPLLTPDFAAPEQILGTAVSPATDVYALGLVLHDLLCGRRRRLPWGLGGGGTTGGTTVFSGTLTCAVGGEPGTQSLFRPIDLDALCVTIETARIDWRIGEVLCTALHADPGQRYPSAADVSLAVEHVLGCLPGPAGSEARSGEPFPYPRQTL